MWYYRSRAGEISISLAFQAFKQTKAGGIDSIPPALDIFIIPIQIYFSLPHVPKESLEKVNAGVPSEWD